jgi:hypothetical protein
VDVTKGYFVTWLIYSIIEIILYKISFVGYTLHHPKNNKKTGKQNDWN